MKFKDRKSKFGGRESGRSERKSGQRFGDRGGDRERKPFNRETYSATCSACARECQVPFKPTSGKPIFCRDCFKKNGNFNPASRGEAPASQPVDLREINRKLDLIITALDIEDEKGN